MKQILRNLLVCAGITISGTAMAQAPRVYDTATSTVIRYPSRESGAVIMYKTEDVSPILMNVMMIEIKPKKNQANPVVARNITTNVGAPENTRRSRKNLRLP